MKNYGIKLISHNIPNVVHRNFNGIFGFRVQNVSEKTLHFHSHYSFYGNQTHERKLQLQVFLNDSFFEDVLLFDDIIESNKKATVFFPYKSKEKSRFNLSIILSPYGSISKDDRKWILSMNIDVKSYQNSYLNKIGRTVLFNLFFLHIPIYFKYLAIYIYKKIWINNAFRRFGKYLKPVDIMYFKQLNRNLAFLEKQTRRLTVRSFPCYLGIDTTSKCNLRCKICFRRYCSDTFINQNDMDSVEMDALIKALFPTAYTLNISTVGEPLLSDHMERILKACTEYRVSLSLTTNGTLLRGERFLQKLGSVLNYIEISVDSASPALFEKLRTGASYKEVIKNSKNLGEIRRKRPDPKFSLGFSMTLFRENLEEIPDVLRLVSEVGGDFLKTDIGVIFEKKDFHRSVLCVPDIYNDVYDSAHQVADKIGIRLLMRAPFSEDHAPESGKCGICDYLYLSACINGEGKLNPCYFQVISSCRITDSGFKSCWNSQEMRKLRLEHDTSLANSHCRNCYLVIRRMDSLANRRTQFLKGDARNWGAVINFGNNGNAKHFKLDGWAKAEEVFTWTVGHEASLRIPIYFPDSSHITLKAIMSGFIKPGKADQQVVYVMVNGTELERWVFETPGFQGKDLVIPSEILLESGALCITFRMPDAVSPYQTGLSDDERRLGIAVQSIELMESSGV